MAEQEVMAAYDRYAARIWENGYRFNPTYMAGPAL